MADRIKLVQGDTGPQLKLTLTDEETGEPIDLTGASATMKFRAVGSTSTLFTRTGFINSQTAIDGIVVFIWQTGDLDLDAGSYEAEVEIIFDGGMRQTVYKLLSFFLREDFT
jgi:hypothetical protein